MDVRQTFEKVVGLKIAVPAREKTLFVSGLPRVTQHSREEACVSTFRKDSSQRRKTRKTLDTCAPKPKCYFCNSIRLHQSV